MKMESTKHKVFISYAQNDRILADLIKRSLEVHGIGGFQIEDMAVGVDFSKQIMDELAASTEILLILTPNYLNSNWGMLELGYALASGKKIIPVLVSPAKLPADLAGYSVLDATKSSVDEIIKKVADVITH